MGYRQYMNQLGVGMYSGFLHVHSPEQIKEGLDYWKEMGVEILADGLQVGMLNRGVLSEKRMRESVLIGRTDEGDKFISTPSRGEALFAVPRGAPSIRKLRHGFRDPLGCCRAVGMTGVLPYFEAQNGRRKMKSFLARGGTAALEKAIMERWGGQEIHNFDTTPLKSAAVYFGVRAIQGMVWVRGSAARARSILVTVSFDDDFAADVRAFAKAIGAPKRVK
jgi:hypothetical protein